MKGRDGRVADHVVPITKDIAAILESLPRFKTGDFLFSTTFGETPVWLSSLAKKRLDARMRRTLRALASRRGERATLPPWVNHDLRRTLRTGLSKLRVDRDIREVVLGHVRPGVEAVYDRHDYFEEKRDALERWAAHVAEIAAPSQTSNVVRLRG
jgi:integrase